MNEPLLNLNKYEFFILKSMCESKNGVKYLRDIMIDYKTITGEEPTKQYFSMAKTRLVNLGYMTEHRELSLRLTLNPVFSKNLKNIIILLEKIETERRKEIVRRNI